MSGRGSRSKGKKGERSARLLFEERDYQVFPRPRGEAGDDFTVIAPDGQQFSVEIKNTRSLNHSMWCQCKRNAGKHNRILCWHPSGWDFAANAWVLFIWRKGEQGRVVVWKGNEDFDTEVDE